FAVHLPDQRQQPLPLGRVALEDQRVARLVDDERAARGGMRLRRFRRGRGGRGGGGRGRLLRRRRGGRPDRPQDLCDVGGLGVAHQVIEQRAPACGRVG